MSLPRRRRPSPSSVPADPPPRALLLDVGKVILDITPPAVHAYAAVSDKTADDFADEFAFFRAIADVAVDLMIDEDAVALMRDARAAGKRVGVLSNDAYSIMGREFFANRPEFAELDAFVDAVDIGVRKPEPAAYQRASEALGVSPVDIVFLDDTPECVKGATAVGMDAIQVDPADRKRAFDQARELLGLPGG
jgi:HAD superfamily hydrolase (TIGR01509 family)